MSRLILILLVCCSCALPQTVSPSKSVPWRVLASEPATCRAGEAYFNSVSAKTRVCIATNTWVDMFRAASDGSLTLAGNINASNLSCTSVTVAYNDTSLNVASTTATKTIVALPANSQITRVFIKHATAFAGTGITTATVSLGDGTTVDAYSPAFDLMATVADATFWTDGGAAATTTAAHNLTATFTSSGGNWNAATAGSVTFYICTGSH